MNRLLDRLAVLPGLAVATALRFSARRAGIALVYHAVAQRAGSPDELVRPHDVALFEAQLRHLGSHYRLVPADGLLDAVAARRRGQRFPVAVTLDDDVESHVSHAAPVLRRLGAPATFFLSGASLERPHEFWWHRLERALAAGLDVPVEGREPQEIARRIEAMTSEDRARVDAWLVEHVADEPEDTGISADDVRRLTRDGFDVGFHTLRHERLTDLADDALVRALHDGREQLETASERRLTVLAYPHGKADARVAAAAREAGFRFGFTGLPHPVQPRSDPLLLGRFEPSHGSVARLAIQLVHTLLRRSHA